MFVCLSVIECSYKIKNLLLDSIFEKSFLFQQDNQKDLENATEQLSEYLEREISSEVLNDIKQKVQDKYR